MGTRRRIASVIAGAALVAGVTLAGSSQAATIVCPPGCVLAGAVKATGGQPDPTSLSLYGSITVAASTVTGDVANAATVNATYWSSIYGSVTRSSAGDLSGTVTFYASRYTPSGTYEYLIDNVAVSGTLQALKLEGPKIKSSLALVNGQYLGPVVYAELGIKPIVQQYCVPAIRTLQDNGVPTQINTRPPIRPLGAVCDY